MKVNFVYDEQKPLNEGLIETYDIVSHPSYLKKKFPCITDIHRTEVNPYVDGEVGSAWHNFIDIDVIDIEDIDDIIKTMDTLCGWIFMNIRVDLETESGEKFSVYFGEAKNWTDQKYRFVSLNLKNDMYFCEIIGDPDLTATKIALCFEPKFGDQVIVRNDLYHVAPAQYREKILRNGLVPKGMKDERVYLAYNLDDIMNMQLPKFGSSSADYCVFKVKIAGDWVEINDKYKFYKDPRWIGCVYTHDCISPEYIKEVRVDR